MALNTPGAAVRHPKRGVLGLALRLVFFCLILVMVIVGSHGFENNPSSQRVVIKHAVLQAGIGGSLVIEASPEMAGSEVQLSLYGPLMGEIGSEIRDPEFFGVAGVQIPWLRVDDQETDVILAAAAGARSIGMDFEWKKIEPTRGQYDWNATDEAVRLAKKYHLKIVPMLLFTPEWASKRPYAPLDFYKTGPIDVTLYRDFVYQVVSRYKPGGTMAETHDGYGITDWVIWNEPNVQGAEGEPLPGGFWIDSLPEYIQLLRAGYEGAHAADPACNVMNGGLADVYWKPGQADLATALERFYDPNGDGNTQDGGRPFFDTLNLHIYPPGKLDEHWYHDRIDVALRVMERFGDSDKKVWITETGLGASPEAMSGAQVQDGELALVSEEEQAKGVELAYRVLATYPQVERVFWWSLRNYAGNAARSNPAMEAHYGLVTVDVRPRPSYLVYMSIANGGGLINQRPVLLDPSGQTRVEIPAGWVQTEGSYLVWMMPGEWGGVEQAGKVIEVYVP